MNNILLIIRREYLTQVKKKSFIVLTLLAPLLLVAFGSLVNFIIRANDTSSTIEVVDNSGLFSKSLKDTKQIHYIFLPESSEKQLIAGLKDMKDIDGLLLIPKTQDADAITKDTKLMVNHKIGLDAKQKIAAGISAGIREQNIRKLGLTEAQISNIDKTFELKTQNIAEDGKGDSDMVYNVKSVLGMVLMYITFTFIIMYGVRVMRSVMEEKNNRVVEIIISSVKPSQLMAGKILGVTLVAVTQFAVWIGMTLGAAMLFNTGLSLRPGMAGGTDIATMLSQISHLLLGLNYPIIILVFLLYFLLGYIFYSSIYAAIGSAVDNETETQQFTIFAVMPLMLGMYGSFGIANNPDGPMGFWLSMIPFTSPVAMIARIPFGVPAWQLAVSIAILILSTVCMVYIAAKVYRIGILLYGNKATPKELWKWIRS